MAKIFLVRHGQASAGWDGDFDPGLSELGREQAEKTAKILSSMAPVPVLTSPMARARQTALPLCSLWQVTPATEPRVGEIPSPDKALSQRREWLRQIMQDRWGNLDIHLQGWRREMIDAVSAITEDTVIFTHFIAINILTGVAVNDDSVVNFLPDNASITILEIHGRNICLVEKGKEASTIIG